MATILREATSAPYQAKRPFPQVDPVPNLLLVLLSTVPPFRSNEALPARVEPRKWAQDFQQPNFQTQGIPIPAVQGRVFRAPLINSIIGRARLQPDLFPNLVATLYKLNVPVPPLLPVMGPEVYRRTDRDFMSFESLSYLPGPVIQPYIPVEFPTPMRARGLPQDFFGTSSNIPPLAPFNQDDWPDVYRKKYLNYGFEWTGVTTRGIPTGVNTPFAQREWPIILRLKQAFHDIPPNTTLRGLPQVFPFFQTEWVTPRRARDFPGESYASPHIVLITPVVRPFAQTDWPELPTRRRSTPWADFYFEAWNTFYRPTVPPGTIAMPNLIGMNFYEAIKVLQQAGIYLPITLYFQQTSQIKIVWVHVKNSRGGIVIDQSVAAGNLVKPGQPLTLTVSSFPFGSLIDLPPDWKQTL
jgi:hypothetical protein